MNNKLDNPVWYALSETHENHCVKADDAKFCQPDYCPFGGFAEKISGLALDKYASLADEFFIVGDRPPIPDSLRLKNELICDQMVIRELEPVHITENIIPLKEAHRRELLDLVNLVQPGYFRNKTSELGNYYGIFKDGILVAVTGERMQMTNAIEVSAVVTHPSYINRGYAKQLVTHATETILSQRKLPFLHVADSNQSAIRLYEKLGFVLRRKISFWQITRNL